MKSALIILIIFFLIPFGQLKKQIEKFDNQGTDNSLVESFYPDKYVGLYQSSDDQACPIDLAITSDEKDGYRYKIKTSKREQEGRLDVSDDGDETYVSFDGLIGAQPKDVIGGQYFDGVITIQNYGNAMNEYLKFDECSDAKYIYLYNNKD